MARLPERSPGPLPAVFAVAGGVVLAMVLLWVVGIVISTVAFVLRIAIVVALVWVAFRVWAFFSRD